MSEKPAYAMKELLEIHPGSRAYLYQEMAAGRLVARKMGGRTIILHEDYMAYLRSLPRAEIGEDAGAGA